MALINLEVGSNQIYQLTLNNPDSLNALTEDLAEEFQMTVRNLALKQAPVRALVIRGAGAAFSAGGDLKMLLAKTQQSVVQNREKMLKFYQAFLSILDLPFPVLAAINGTAVGAGLALACACDFRVVSSSAKLGFGFIKLGLHPGMGSTFFLPRLVGVARSNELFLSNKVFDAEYALSINLINRVLTAENFEQELNTYLAEVFTSAPEASAQLIQSLRPSRAEYFPNLEREAFCQSVNYASAEFKEGVSAMLEKRKPSFQL